MDLQSTVSLKLPQKANYTRVFASKGFLKINLLFFGVKTFKFKIKIDAVSKYIL